MARKATTTELILDTLADAKASGCSLEELISACSGLTWNQVFLEVDRLSRDSVVLLTHDKPGVYCVRLSKPSSTTSAAAEGR